MANKLAIKFIIISCIANKEILLQRLSRRHNLDTDDSDATVDVLKSQMKLQQPISNNEKRDTIVVNTGIKLQITPILDKIKAYKLDQTSS